MIWIWIWFFSHHVQLLWHIPRLLGLSYFSDNHIDLFVGNHRYRWLAFLKFFFRENKIYEIKTCFSHTLPQCKLKTRKRTRTRNKTKNQKPKTQNKLIRDQLKFQDHNQSHNQTQTQTKPKKIKNRKKE